MVDQSESLVRSISEALVAFLTLESKCGMGEVYSETFLYATICRVASHLGWRVRCEVPVGDERKGAKGDHRRLDFVFYREKDLTQGGRTAPRKVEKSWVALEVKFKRARLKRDGGVVKVAGDIDKLTKFRRAHSQKKHEKAKSYILVVGRAPFRKHSTKPALRDHAFTLSKKGKRDLAALSGKQKEVCVTTSNTCFVASRVEV